MKLEHSLTPYRKIKSRWIKNLNVRPDNRTLRGKKIGRTLFDINHSIIYLDPPSRVMKIKTGSSLTIEWLRLCDSTLRAT